MSLLKIFKVQGQEGKDFDINWILKRTEGAIDVISGVTLRCCRVPFCL